MLVYQKIHLYLQNKYYYAIALFNSKQTLNNQNNIAQKCIRGVL